MATKTPSKGKKAAGKEATKKRAKPAAKAAAGKKEKEKEKPAIVVEEEEALEIDEERLDVADADPADDDDDDDDDDDEAEARPAAAAAPPGAKPAVGAPAAVAAKKPTPRGRMVDTPEAPPVVPARRLTPEAKARVNEMVARGVPLGDALRQAASWETFVAPVKDEPAKLVQGKSFEGGARPQVARGGDDDEGPAETDDDEPAAADSDE